MIKILDIFSLFDIYIIVQILSFFTYYFHFLGASFFLPLKRTSSSDSIHSFLLPTSLSAGIWYRLIITSSDAALNDQSEGVKGIILFSSKLKNHHNKKVALCLKQHPPIL
jgi:hypothetical protein